MHIKLHSEGTLNEFLTKNVAELILYMQTCLKYIHLSLEETSANQESLVGNRSHLLEIVCKA